MQTPSSAFLLYFNLNHAEGLEHFINPKRRAADMKFFRDAVGKFNTPEEELAPFFTVVNNQSFGFTKIYDRMSWNNDFSINNVRDYLPDAQTMLAEVMHFYFPGKIAEALPSVAELADLIGNMTESALVKYHLLAMTINAQRYYDILINSLDARVQQMTAYYKKNKSMIDSVKSTIDESYIKEFFHSQYGMTDEFLTQDLEYSVLLISKNAVRDLMCEKLHIILGTEYRARLELLREQAIQPDIVKMGKALSEEKRVLVLEMLLSEKELTAQQLLQKLELSMTATHYHLDMLLQAGMLNTRNEGRTIYYSLNRAYFDHAPIVFDRYNTMGGEE